MKNCLDKEGAMKLLISSTDVSDSRIAAEQKTLKFVKFESLSKEANSKVDCIRFSFKAGFEVTVVKQGQNQNNRIHIFWFCVLASFGLD